METCLFCKEPLSNGQPTAVLYEKGCSNINRISVLRDDVIQVSAGQSVHQSCRRQYCNTNILKRDLKKAQATKSTRTLRSGEPDFVFSEHCMFCGQAAKLYGKKRGCDVFPVKTSDFQYKITQICLERDDSWSEKVYSRIESVHDLHAADAIYHQVCSSNFRTGKQIPLAFQPTVQAIAKQIRIGRPKDVTKEEAFLKVTEFLQDNDDEQITMTDLIEKMREYGCDDVYSTKYMKMKILEHFGDNVIITNLHGKASVVTFRRTASDVLNEFFESPKLSDSEDEKLRFVRTVGDLIKSDIKSMDASKETYPTSEELSSVEHNMSYVPETLKILLQTIFAENDADTKIVSVAQAIIQAARPRGLLAPLQIGLGIQMHHHFASKFLIDSLHSHGFCSSYSEVKRFEVCAASSQGTTIAGIESGHCVQYVADNADHNINTLDGFNTFHGMGIIAAITPGIKCHKPVPRCHATTEDVTRIGRINIHFFKAVAGGLLPLTYDELGEVPYEDPMNNLDVLWKIIWPLRSPRPGWSGMMQAVTQGSYPGKSSIVYLPMIDMSATDMSCIYSTLRFVCTEARRHKVHPILTFDQPLWWKAQTIIASEPQRSDLHSIVLRLGGFHTEMSFLGCIGHIMRGTGLEELLEVVYAPNTVIHMMSGKALARAVRGHFLVNATLNSILVAKAFNLQLPKEKAKEADMLNESQEFLTGEADRTVDPMDEDLTKSLELFDKLMNKEVEAEMVSSDDCFTKIKQKLAEAKYSMASSRTAQLWLQYMDMVDLLSEFIKGERTGTWLLHLKTLKAMLPYLAAAGHNLYAKSAYIYFQQMMQLESQKPEVFNQFVSGYHVVRRSDRYWAGLSTDLVIEQVLMRSMKATGGLTRGRGMSESKRSQWLLSMPACSDVNGAMQELTDTQYVSSDQHKDMTEARQKRDDNDMRQLLGFLQDRNPFDGEMSLINIATGVTADASVNVDNAKEIGQKILMSMAGNNVLEYTFKRKNQAVVMSHKSSVKIDGNSIHVDPQLLFQRLITAARDVTGNVAEIFKYELCNHPSSLFDSNGLLRQANKPVLAEAIWTMGKGNATPEQPVEEDMTYVLDGGSLLQRIPWPRNSTFNSICIIYEDYIERKYQSPIIVFDGYAAGPSTKDVTHQRRSGGAGAQVHFVGDMLLTSKKEHFLANPTNKQQFINMLSKRLQDKGCHTIHAEGDADLLIVQTAVDSASKGVTTVIGEDTDLLVLLCFHAKPLSFDLFLKSEAKKSTKVQKIWNIHHLQANLGAETCSLLPFVHAVAGCDTTSRLFGIGKGLALKKLKNDPNFKEQAKVFCRPASKAEIISAGEEAIKVLYGGMPREDLNVLRFRRFSEKVSTSLSCVQVHSLPPTSSAAQNHSMRVYLQVQQWMGIDSNLEPEEWGWIQAEGQLVPRTTNLLPAPDSLLRVIHCNCRTDCDSRRCTCRKHGLDCSTACGECKGVSCTNSSRLSADTLDDS